MVWCGVVRGRSAEWSGVLVTTEDTFELERVMEQLSLINVLFLLRPAVPDNLVAMGDPPPQIMDLSELSDFFDEEDDDGTFTIDPSIFSTASPTTWIHPTTQNIIQTTPTKPHSAEEPTEVDMEEDLPSSVKVSVQNGTTLQSELAELQGASSTAMATWHCSVTAVLCVLALNILTHLL